MSGPVVGFAGLTHLGVVSAVAAASTEFRVVAFDGDPAHVDAVASGHLPVFEPDLDRLLRQHRARLDFSSDLAALRECAVVYVAADVPTNDDAISDLRPITALIESITPVLNQAAVLVVLCQVPPGFTRSLGGPPLTRRYYQVETLVVGRAVERALQPERHIVGCADADAPLPASYRAVLEAFDCPVLPMRYESAELAKIAINCCLAASVTITNTLAAFAERVHADWAEIAPALRLDRRIGPHAYLTPGLGLAGGNLERDLVTVMRLSAEVGSEVGVVAAFMQNSHHRRDWALRTLHAELLAAKPDAVIAVLGLAYKENTRSTKNSPALALIAHLAPWELRLYDPVVPVTWTPSAATVACGSALDAARGADAVVIMTPWAEFRDLKPADLASVMRGRTVLDPYRVLEARSSAAAGLDYCTLGAPVLRAR